MLLADHWFYPVLYFMLKARSLQLERLAEIPANRWYSPCCQAAVPWAWPVTWQVFLLMKLSPFQNQTSVHQLDGQALSFGGDPKVLEKVLFLGMPLENRPGRSITTHSLLIIQPSFGILLSWMRPTFPGEGNVRVAVTADSGRCSLAAQARLLISGQRTSPVSNCGSTGLVPRTGTLWLKHSRWESGVILLWDVDNPKSLSLLFLGILLVEKTYDPLTTPTTARTTKLGG